MRSRLSLFAFAMLTAAVARSPAQDDIQKGKIEKIDLDRLIVTLNQGTKGYNLLVTESTRLPDGKGATVKERLQAYKPGDAVMFKSDTRDGKFLLVGMKLAAGVGAVPGPRVTPDTSDLKPLTELGSAQYKGFAGGLYGGGKNERPPAHEAAGQALAKQVRPLDADGKPSPDGKIVLLSIGMSNTSQASEAFRKALAGDPQVNPRLLFVNGAVGGMTARAIQDPESGSGKKYWAEVDNRLRTAGVTRAQVQAVWIKEADAGPSQGFPGYAKTLEEELKRIVCLLPARFPNVKLAYLSSRTYGGYARTKLNPEPYAFESGLAVQWLIEEQLKGEPALSYDPKKGEVHAPWLSWGPYLWANGTTKRSDGFSYAEGDFANDGTHLSESGMAKVGRLMRDFFKSDATTRPWFQKASAPGTSP